jgi:Cof subfamily protein (haloacid dehalogenase superfamily)
MTGDASARPGIRLLLADVDGTLLTGDRTLASSTIRAAHALREGGIALAITSSRPPRGLLQFIEALGIDTPTGAFNGGAFVRPDLTVLAQSLLPAELGGAVIEVIRREGLDVWVYSGDEWYVQDPDGPHVVREQRTVRFAPEIVDSYDGVIDRAVKIVGVTDDPALMESAERATRELSGDKVSASKSQTYYLDVTHPDANKGNVVGWLSDSLGIPSEQIATIGDGPNDIRMFQRSGLSIAMGNAGPEVKAQAMTVTSSNDEDGFARAIDTHILSKR